MTPPCFQSPAIYQEWGENMLNYGAKTTTFSQLMKEALDPEKLLFIRPDDDNKSFAGEMIKYEDCLRCFEGLQTVENSGVSLESRIIVGEPYQIGREWQL